MAADFVVAAMHTDAYADKAARLLASCERFGIAHDIRRVPSVHQSISRRGTPDLAFTKPAFILDALARHRRPVLYIDADCEIRAAPALIGELLGQGVEFAIFNWAADRHTEAYLPAPIVLGTPDGVTGKGPRYYRLAWKFPYYDPAQLLCSGAVQLYADTPAARGLLEAWRRTIERFPEAADDFALSYAYNNRGPDLTRIRASWLPKPYARYAWWIQTEPVIDHPEIAAEATHFKPIDESDGRKPFYPERAEQPEDAPLFPPDSIVDAHARRLLKIENKAIVGVQPLTQELWT